MPHGESVTCYGLIFLALFSFRLAITTGTWRCRRFFSIVAVFFERRPQQHFGKLFLIDEQVLVLTVNDTGAVVRDQIANGAQNFVQIARPHVAGIAPV
jgi:hypothetical protein